MKRAGKKINGWLVLDKPVGMSSAKAVAIVKSVFGAQKAGHAGTLDPLASGLLPIALGEATKTVPYLVDGEKEYVFSVVFGEARSTDDGEGEVIATSAHRPSDDEIKAALSSFIGEIDQIPPTFSAIKLEGRRAYDMARGGEKIEMKSRKVQVSAFKFLERISPDCARFEVCCGKGTYIRSLARDLAQHLGSCGYAADLRRSRVGPFHEGHAILLDRLTQSGHSPAPLETLLPIETALDDIPALALTAPEAISLKSGQAIGFMSKPDLNRLPSLIPGMVVRAKDGERLLALVRYDEGKLKPVRVMNL